MRQRAKENEKETKRKRYAPRIIQGRTHTEIETEKATESETTWRETDGETTRRVRETVTQIHTQRKPERQRYMPRGE